MKDSPDIVLARLDEQKALAGIRIAAEVNWEFGADIGTERFIAYEARLNAVPPECGSSLICLCDWHQTPPPVIQSVLRTHPVAIVGEWVHESPFFEPVDAILGQSDVERTTADWIAARLEARTRRQMALFDLGRLVLESTSADDPMRAAPDLIAAALQIDHVSLFELLPLGETVRLIGSSGLDRAAIGSDERLEAGSLFADAARRLWVTDGS